MLIPLCVYKDLGQGLGVVSLGQSLCQNLAQSLSLGLVLNLGSMSESGAEFRSESGSVYKKI